MEKKITKKKKPTITGLTRKLRELKKRSSELFDSLQRTASAEQFLRGENNRLQSDLNSVNRDVCNLGNELSETKMWYGKAQHTIVELKEELHKEKTLREAYDAQVKDRILIPNNNLHFYIDNDRLCSAQACQTVFDRFCLENGKKEISISEVYSIYNNIYKEFTNVLSKIDKFTTTIKDGDLIGRCVVESYIVEKYSIFNRLKCFILRRKIQSLKDYARLSAYTIYGDNGKSIL